MYMYIYIYIYTIHIYIYIYICICMGPGLLEEQVASPDQRGADLQMIRAPCNITC